VRIPTWTSGGPNRAHATGGLAACALLLAAAPARATETVVDDFESASSPAPWVFSNGPEFPGATGSLTSGTGHTGKGAHLAFDFSGGGHYVAATLSLTTPLTAAAVGYWVRAPAVINAKLRVVDSGGQTLQYDVTRPLEAATDASAWYHEVVELDAPSSHYGGANDGVVHEPIAAISILAADPLEPGVAGALDFDDVSVFDALAPSLSEGEATLSTPPGHPTLASRLAVNIHFTSDDRALDLAKAAGFAIVRMDLGWSGVERTTGVYDFTSLDALVASLASRGMRLHLILDYFNALYPDPSSASFAATTVPAFAALAKATAAHFAGENVTYEVWNEPNLAGFWPPAPSSTQYATLCAAAIAAVHQGDSAAKVSTAGISGFDFAFLQGYLDAGGAVGADAVGVHPYRQTGPESVAADYLQMRTVVGATPPIWDTEWGYSSTWYGDGHDPATRTKQAVYAAREILSAWAIGFPLAVYYDVRDDGTDGGNAEDNFGLFQNDYSDKPAAVAVRTLSTFAAPYAFAGFAPLEPSSLHAMRLDGTDSEAWALWSEAPGASITVTLAQSPTPTVIDALGNSVALGSGGAVVVSEPNGPLYVSYPLPPGDGGLDGSSGPAADAGALDGAAPDGSAADGAAGDATVGGGDAGSLQASVHASSGCGCRAASARPSRGSMLLGLAALAALVRRRRARAS
jgi:MYXO-CTERM domain-containing protein